MNRSSISSVLWGWAATSGGPAPADDDDPDADDAFLRFALALALALPFFLRLRFFFFFFALVLVLDLDLPLSSGLPLLSLDPPPSPLFFLPSGKPQKQIRISEWRSGARGHTTHIPSNRYRSRTWSWACPFQRRTLRRWRWPPAVPGAPVVVGDKSCGGGKVRGNESKRFGDGGGVEVI